MIILFCYVSLTPTTLFYYLAETCMIYYTVYHGILKESLPWHVASEMTSINQIALGKLLVRTLSDPNSYLK